VAQPFVELAQLRVVHPAGGLFAVPRHERHGGATIQQLHRGPDLARAHTEFFGDAVMDGGLDARCHACPFWSSSFRRAILTELDYPVCTGPGLAPDVTHRTRLPGLHRAGNSPPTSRAPGTDDAQRQVGVEVGDLV